MIWLLRMKRWVQHPPSKRRIYLIGGVVLICLSIGLIEHYLGWPEWLTTDQRRLRTPLIR